MTSRYLFGWANRNDAAHVQSEVDAADSAVNQLDINSDNLFKIIKGERLGLTRKLHTLESERLDGCSVEVKEAICGVRKNFQELQREAEGLQADLSDLSESDRKKAEQQIKELFSKQFIRLGVFENTALRGIWQQRTQLEALRGAAQDNNSHMNQLWKRIEHQRLPQQSSPFPALTYKQ